MSRIWYRLKRMAEMTTRREVNNLAVIVRGDALSQLARPAGSLHHKTRNRNRRCVNRRVLPQKAWHRGDAASPSVSSASDLACLILPPSSLGIELHVPPRPTDVRWISTTTSTFTASPPALTRLYLSTCAQLRKSYNEWSLARGTPGTLRYVAS